MHLFFSSGQLCITLSIKMADQGSAYNVRTADVMKELIRKQGWTPNYKTVRRDIDRARNLERQEHDPTYVQPVKKPRLVPPPPKASSAAVAVPSTSVSVYLADDDDTAAKSDSPTKAAHRAASEDAASSITTEMDEYEGYGAVADRCSPQPSLHINVGCKLIAHLKSFSFGSLPRLEII